MIRKLVLAQGILILLILVARTAHAEGFPWRDHAPPFDTLFGNHIDSHQQAQAMGVDQLVGFFYIRFTGESEQELPEATHADCPLVADECTVGWMLSGVSIRATYLGHPAGQHPLWCVDEADIPRQPGYSHFHWLGAPPHAGGLLIGEEYDGFLLKLTARDSFFFSHHGGFPVVPGIDTVTHANITTTCE